MSPIPSTKCDTDRLQQLLTDQLPERLQREIAEHLTGCERCRGMLESLAGDVGWWSEVTSCLQALGRDTTQSGSDLSGIGESADGDDSFAADFVVEFLEPADEPGLLGRLGEYEILDVIGRGGMGVVLKGFQRELGRFVAVKVMAPHLASSGAARQRFVREARAAAAIVHPHVMPIHSVCTTSRLPYLVMPFVACESLQQRIDRQGALEIPEILRIGLQVAQGLAASHAQGLVHRDIKPANILLEKGVDRVMLTDFGLARAVDDASLTRTGIVTGTPQYMSPEQSCGEQIDPRSDLFSLGSVLYAMSAGRPPFRAETTLAVLRRITDTQARSLREVNPAIPEWLEGIVTQLHEKRPEDRIPTAAEVAALLEQGLAHVQQPTVIPAPQSGRRRSSDTNTQSTSKHRRIQTMPVLMTGAALVLMLALLLFVRDLMTPRGPLASNDNQYVTNDVAQNSELAEVANEVQEVVPVEAPSSTAEVDRRWDAVPDEIEQLLQSSDPVESRAVRTWDLEPLVVPTVPSAKPSVDSIQPSKIPDSKGETAP